MTNILDGKKVSKELLCTLKEKMYKLKMNHSCVPTFISVLVGDDNASKIYLNQKKLRCEEVGIKFTLLDLPYKTTTEKLLETINILNKDTTVDAYIVQLPLPIHINTSKIIAAIDSTKDVDCFSHINIGKLITKEKGLYPATPYGIILLFDYYNIDVKGKNCVIIGKSMIVGTPLALMLSNEYTKAGTVTLCDKYTENLKEYVNRADIIIVAAGVHHLINKEYIVKSTSVIVDVGMHHIKDTTKKTGYRLEGDVDYSYFKDKCAYITPVPGGVGPMTVYALLDNIYTASVNHHLIDFDI